MSISETPHGETSYLDAVRAVEPQIGQRVVDLDAGFHRVFPEQANGSEVIVRAPGRVELLGNHTDYNLGLTLSAAINASTLVGLTSNGLDRFRVFSKNINRHSLPPVVEIDPQDMRRSPENSPDDWTNYIKGVIEEMRARFGGKNITPCDFYIESDIPLGSGFSSSAALELALVKGIMETSQIHFSSDTPNPLLEIIKLARAAEVGPYVGARTGYLDQATSALGEVAYLNFLPSTDGEPISQMEQISLDVQRHGLTFLVASDPELKHKLADFGGGYTTRVLEAELFLHYATRILDRKMSSLGELYAEENFQQLADVKALTDLLQDENKTIFKRMRHVLTEMGRVAHAKLCLEGGDVQMFGEIMTASGRSALEDYHIGEGVPALEWTYMHGLLQKGVVGVRNMGGGFNNTTLWLVKISDKDRIIRSMQEAYKTEFGKNREAQLDFVEFAVAPGVGRIK